MLQLSQSISQQKKATCAVMVIVRDAAGTIRECMDSIIKSGCFEQVVVVVDSRSRDDTVKILTQYAKRFPIQLVKYRWSTPGDFAAVRNAAISLFTTDYGFWLDADETLVEPVVIKNLLKRAKGQAFNLIVVSPMEHSSFDMKQPRLFPIRPGVFFESPVFERLDWSIRRAGIPIENTEYKPIYHVGYLDSGILERKRIRNLSIAVDGLYKPMGLDARDHLYQQYRRMI